jgi:hypothetical protein
MAYVLSTYGVLEFDEADRAEEISNNAAKASLNHIQMNQFAKIRSSELIDHDSDFDSD